MSFNANAVNNMQKKVAAANELIAALMAENEILKKDVVRLSQNNVQLRQQLGAQQNPGRPRF